MTDKTEISATDTQGASRTATAFILITLFINSMGFGLSLPVLPTLLMELTGEGIAGAALVGGIATFIYSIMQFVFAPIMGALSDRYGRRPILLVSLMMFAIDNLVLAFAWSVWIFVLARTLAGIFAATNATANAFISDVTPPEQRGQRFALIGAAFGAGFVFGPAIGGLLGEISPRAPFFAAAALAAANGVLGYFILPETLPRNRRRPFSWARANPFGTLSTLIKTPGLGVLLPIFFFASLSTWVYPSVWSYVAVAKFDWSESEIGLSVAYYGVIAILSQAVIIQLLLPRCGVRLAIWMALGVEAISLIGIGVAPTGFFVYVMITLALISSMQDAALRQELSAKVPDDAQGELQGGLSAINGVAMFLSPIIYTQLFWAFSGGTALPFYPGAPFLCAAVFTLIALVLYAMRTGRNAPSPL